jgi:hypothetical protein
MNTRKKPKRPSEARCYDVEMIRDFLDHLLWEVRISHYESQSNKINPELAEQLERYQKKRQTVGLLFATEIGAASCSQDADKYRELQRIKGEFRNSQLLCLEALRSLFAEALENAARPKTFNIVRFETVEEAVAAFERRKKEHETGEC